MTNPIVALDSIEFSVEVEPQPQGSMSGFVPKGWTTAVITDSNKNLKPYRKEVTRAALEQRAKMGFHEVMFGKHVPVVMTLNFYFEKPKSVSSKRKEPVAKPDLDKLIRGTSDALTGNIYKDDAQVIALHAFKFYGLPERVEIKVEGKFTDTPQSLFVTHEDDF